MIFAALGVLGIVGYGLVLAWRDWHLEPPPPREFNVARQITLGDLRLDLMGTRQETVGGRRFLTTTWGAQRGNRVYTYIVADELPPGRS